MSLNPNGFTCLMLWILAGAVLFTLADSGQLSAEAFAGTAAVAYLLTLSTRKYGPF